MQYTMPEIARMLGVEPQTANKYRRKAEQKYNRKFGTEHPTDKRKTLFSQEEYDLIAEFNNVTPPVVPQQTSANPTGLVRRDFNQLFPDELLYVEETPGQMVVAQTQTPAMFTRTAERELSTEELEVELANLRHLNNTLDGYIEEDDANHAYNIMKQQRIERELQAERRKLNSNLKAFNRLKEDSKK